VRNYGKGGGPQEGGRGQGGLTSLSIKKGSTKRIETPSLQTSGVLHVRTKRQDGPGEEVRQKSPKGKGEVKDPARGFLKPGGKAGEGEKRKRVPKKGEDRSDHQPLKKSFQRGQGGSRTKEVQGSGERRD